VSGLEARSGLPVAAKYPLAGATRTPSASSVVISFSRIQSVVCYPRANVGVVSVYAVDGGGGGSVVGRVAAGAGHMNAAWVHVPTGYVGEIVALSASCVPAAATATITLSVVEANGTRILRNIGVTPGAAYVGEFSEESRAIYTVDELGTAIIKATASTDNNIVTANLAVKLRKSPNTPTAVEKFNRRDATVQALIESLRI
jgi:hypothetical protein